MHLPNPPEPAVDDLVGLDLVMSPARRRRFEQKLADSMTAADRLVLPALLAPFMHLPAPEARTLTRARLAATIASLVAANGNVTRDELLAAGFDEAEIAEHFTQARRIARVERMVS